MYIETLEFLPTTAPAVHLKEDDRTGALSVLLPPPHVCKILNGKFSSPPIGPSKTDLISTGSLIISDVSQIFLMGLFIAR